MVFKFWRELRPSPIDVFAAGPVFLRSSGLDLFTTEAEASEEQILQVLSNKGTVYDVNLAELWLIRAN